jgi:hypothetical protein
MERSPVAKRLPLKCRERRLNSRWAGVLVYKDFI